MHSLSGIAIQVGLIFVPAILFIVLKSCIKSKGARLFLSILLAAGTGACAFFLASEYGWKPMMKSGRPVDASPVALFWIFAGTILVILLLFVFSKSAGEKGMAGKSNTDRNAETRGWRVGHTGRDRMYYEEFREGSWQQIMIDGEMLMGPAHHVIYFASPEQWESYPRWARGRRDEIVGRIKSEFAPPDYEYYGD